MGQCVSRTNPPKPSCEPEDCHPGNPPQPFANKHPTGHIYERQPSLLGLPDELLLKLFAELGTSSLTDSLPTLPDAYSLALASPRLYDLIEHHITAIDAADAAHASMTARELTAMLHHARSLTVLCLPVYRAQDVDMLVSAAAAKCTRLETICFDDAGGVTPETARALFSGKNLREASVKRPGANVLLAAPDSSLEKLELLSVHARHVRPMLSLLSAPFFLLRELHVQLQSESGWSMSADVPLKPRLELAGLLGRSVGRQMPRLEDLSLETLPDASRLNRGARQIRFDRVNQAWVSKTVAGAREKNRERGRISRLKWVSLEAGCVAGVVDCLSGLLPVLTDAVEITANVQGSKLLFPPTAFQEPTDFVD